jgi:hypothetical protein
MIKKVLLLFCGFQALVADESIYFHRDIIALEGQEVVVNSMNLSIDLDEEVEAPVALISRCVAGIAGRLYGRYLAVSYDIPDEDITMVTVTGAITCVMTVGLLLENQKVVRTASNAYRLCMKG